MIQLSHKLAQVKPSATIQINAKAISLIAEGKKIIKFNIGEPDFDTPSDVKDAAIAAIMAGQTKYTHVDGTPALKEAIITKFQQDNGLSYNPQQIIVSSGAKQSLFNLFFAVLNRGDEVIIPAPYWVSYPDMVRLCEGTPVIVSTTMENNLKLTPEELEANITAKTRLVLLNSPSNPTGTAYARKELEAIGQVLLKYPDILIMTDDIYEHIYWAAEPFCNIVMACPELYSRTVVINGPSKAYAMTGWRIGYAAGDEAIIKGMKKCQSQSTSNPCSISQAATVAALSGDQNIIKSRCDAFKQRHDLIMSLMQDTPGFECVPGDGTFYVFPNVEGAIASLADVDDDVAFADFLLEHAGVACVPGTAFGAPGFIRISYALSEEDIRTAMAKIKMALNEASYV